MKNYRMGRNTTEHYTSFQEAAKAWGCRSINKRTKDEKKLEKQKADFCNKHKCQTCGMPMSWVPNTNVFTCKNDSCKGIKHEYIDSLGETKIFYEVSKDLLDELGTEICLNIFS